MFKMLQRYPLFLGLLALAGIACGSAAAIALTAVLSGGISVALIVRVVAGVALLLAGACYLPYLARHKHGLLDGNRNQVRTDLMGQVATVEEEEGLLSKLHGLMSVLKVADKFRKYVFAQLSVPDEHEFGKEMLFRLGEAYKNHADPLIRGDLVAASRKRYPSGYDAKTGNFTGQFEINEELPAHMEPSIFDNDKLITGEDVSLLAYRYVHDDDLKAAYGTSLTRVQETASYVPSAAGILGLGATVLAYPVLSAMTQSAAIGALVALFSGAALAAGAALWVLTQLAEKALHVRSVSAFAQHKVNCDETLLDITRAMVLRKEQLKKPLAGLPELRQSLNLAFRDKNPVMQLGFGTGHALMHGTPVVHAYMEGQPVCLTNDDLSRGGVIILGATGSGKSFSILIPLMAQIMRAPFSIEEMDEAKKDGFVRTVSMVTFDPKAALHHDATRLAANCGWESRNIGVGVDEWGLDLFDGLSPVIIIAIQSEAMAQKNSGATKGDPFWDSMGAKLRYSASVIARVYEMTDAGLAEVESSGERIYSFVGVYKLVMACRSADGYLFKVVDGICRAIRDPEQRKYFAPYLGPELIAAIDFLRRDVLTQFSEATVGGFIANVTDSLADFISENDIRERFGSARGRILDIDRLFDNRVCTNFVLSRNRYGDVARIVTIMSKIRLYHRGALRQEMDPQIGKCSKTIVVGDECQQFVTSGGTYSETEYINTSRAYGFSFILATQTCSALAMALGSALAATNMLAQLRSKVILGNEDADTWKFLHSIVGDSLQAQATSEDSHENIHAWRREVFGTINDHIVPTATSGDDMLLLSHPLVHGRIEPLLASVKKEWQAANIDQVASYEAMYEGGEEWIGQYAKQGMFAVFGGNKKVKQNGVRDGLVANEFGRAHCLRPIYDSDDMKMSVGQAIVVTNNQNLVKHDKIILTHHLGFLTDTNTVDVEAKELAAGTDAKVFLDSAPNRVKETRRMNAEKPVVAPAVTS
jgi:hypothetical protein